MSIAQQAINALRNGDFLKIITLSEEITKQYAPIYAEAASKLIAQDELQQLLAYELASTDINKDDLTKLHLLERLIHNSDIYNHLSGKQRAGLISTLSAFCTAISIKKVENHLDSIPFEVTKESIEEFLSDNSQFSQVISNNDCEDSMTELQQFIMKNSDVESIKDLIANIKQDTNNTSFIRGLFREQKETQTSGQKVNQLKPICNQYIQHLETIIEKHIKENNTSLHASIFEDAPDISNQKGGIHQLDKVCDRSQNGGLGFDALKELMDNNSNFKLAVDKYRAVSDMLNKLEDKSQLSQSSLESFKTAFNDNKKLLHTRRDSAGTTFLKGVATVLSLGSILLFKNFWKPESQKQSQEIQSVLTAKL